MESDEKSPRVKEKSVRIKEIQEAAKKVFFSKGFINSSMDEIAAQADVSKGTLYVYFKNKDDLYVSLMKPVLDELGKRLGRFASKVERRKLRDKGHFFSELLKCYLGTYKFDPDGFRIIQAFQIGNHFSSMPAATIEALNQRAATNYQTIRGLLKSAMEAGYIKETDPIKLADLLWAVLLGVVQLEESKYRITHKDHLKETLSYSFELLSRAL
jgi:AcrR family transcriptional regulator